MTFMETVRKINSVGYCIDTAQDHGISGPSQSILVQLSDTYAALVGLQVHINKLLHADEVIAESGGRVSLQWQEKMEQCTSSVGDFMLQIAWQVSNMPANDLDDAKAKASVLLDWVGLEEGDISDQLAASLGRDLLALAPASKPGLPARVAADNQ